MRVKTRYGLLEEMKRTLDKMWEFSIKLYWWGTSFITKSKDYFFKKYKASKGFRWFVWGLVFSILALIIWIGVSAFSHSIHAKDPNGTNLIYDRNGDGVARVTIDAGHGGNGSTAGKRTPDGVYEWNMNNAIANNVEKILEEQGIEVIRLDDVTGNTDVPLSARSSMANQYNADVHLSIHNNAFGSGTEWGEWSGTEAFVKHPSSEAHKLADEILSNIQKNTGLKNRGVKFNNLHMTREVKVPSVLIEGGFMDSVIDKPIIDDPWGQQAIGEGIADAVLDWLKCGL